VTASVSDGCGEIWQPAPNSDAAARASAEHTFRSCAARRVLGDSDSGVFATCAIGAGVVLIHRWHDEYRGLKGWQVLSVEEIDRLPPASRALFLRYGLDHDFGYICGPTDLAHVTSLDNFINHACAPNLGYDDAGNVVALREISPGEELRIDYGSFIVNYDEPFQCSCGHESCRGTISRDDWRILASRPGVILPPFVRRRIEAKELFHDRTPASEPRSVNPAGDGDAQPPPG
jgi:hypothetical protein